MRIHRITALFTAAALAFLPLPVKVSAAEALDLEVGRVTAEAEAGQRVKVPITAKTNPGYTAGRINVNWDAEALTLKKVTYNDENAPDNGAAAVESSGTYCLFFGDMLTKENFTGTGEFFTLEFVVTAEAVAGDYVISLDQPNVVDTDLETVDVTTAAGLVTLTGDAVSENSLNIEVGNASATLGEDAEIKIPVAAKQNPGFAAGTADLIWDSSALTLTDVEFSDIAPDNSSAAIKNTGSYRVSFGNYVAKTNYAETGTLFTLVFKVNEGAPADEYQIMLGNPQVYNVELERVAVNIKSGKAELMNKTTTTSTTAASTTTSTTTSSTTSKSSSTTTSSTTSSTTSKPSSTTTSSTTSSTTSKTTSTTTTSTTKPLDYNLGDPNLDGKTDASDASFILGIYAILSTGGTPDITEEQAKAADVNKDGKIDSKDASTVLSYYSYTSTGGKDDIEAFLKV